MYYYNIKFKPFLKLQKNPSYWDDKIAVEKSNGRNVVHDLYTGFWITGVQLHQFYVSQFKSNYIEIYIATVV